MRWAYRVWIVLAVAVCIRTVVSPENHSIFPILAGGTAHWWADQPLYADYKPLDFFRYPPVFAVAFTPFEALGTRAGGILWSLFGIGVLFVGLRRFLRDVLPGHWTPGREAVFLVLGALGALPGLWNAQSNALAAGLLLSGAALLMRERWWTASALLAGSILIKLTPLAPALLLCVLQPRRLTSRLALFVGMGLLIPFLTRPPAVVLDHYREWFAQMAYLGGERWPGFRDAWTVWLVVRQWACGVTDAPDLKAPLHSVAYRVLQLSAAAATLAWCLWQRQRIADPRRLVTVVLATGMAWLMLFGPATEHATYVFLAPFLIWAFLERDARPADRLLIGSALFLILFPAWDAVGRMAPAFVPVLLTSLPAGTMLFTVWIIRRTGWEMPFLSRKHEQRFPTVAHASGSERRAMGGFQHFSRV